MEPERWRLISHLYQAALEHRAEDRTGFLREACADDDLRREVELLLADRSGAQGFPEVPALEAAARRLTPPPPKLAAGARVGPYRIVSLLGAGGMGQVYRAHDSTLARDVALKVLPPDLADDRDRRARMLREARAAAALNHPNICTIYEVGEAGGQTFIAMEVVDGVPLSVRLEGRELPLDEVLRIGRQLAEAVAHAHDHGIVHRDLKGANVMVLPDGRIKVLDFGLAKRMTGAEFSAATTRAEPLTRPHSVLGTVPYMSPEQLRAQPADARSDVWSLGVMLYEMVAGRLPFGGRTAFEMTSEILNAAPPPLEADVPVALRAVIARCLEKEPGRRYQRAGELRAALDTVNAATSSPSTLEPPPDRAGMPMPVAVALAVAIAVVGGALWWRVGGSLNPPEALRAPRIQAIAVLPLENLSGDPAEDYFAAGMHEALITDLSRIGLQKVIAKASADVFKGTTRPPREIGRELGVEGLVTGSVLRSNDRIQIAVQLLDADTGAVVWANRYERNAGDVLSLQNDVVGAIASEVRATLTPAQAARLATARPLNAAAHDAYLKGRSLAGTFANSPFDAGRLEATLSQFNQAIALDPSYAEPHAAIAMTFVTASQMSLFPPGETFPKAKAAALRAVQLDETLAAAHASLGEVHTWYDWNWAAAEREIQRALDLNPDSADALRASVVLHTLVTGRPDDAGRTSERILALDPLNPFSRLQRVWVSFFSRRHDDSIRLANNLLEVWPDAIMGPFFLASNYAVTRMPERVGAECGKVMRALSGAYVMQIIGQCAWAYARAGNVTEARRLLGVVEKPPGGVWLDPVVIGSVYGELGNIDRAMEWFQKGLAERSPNMIYMKAAANWDSVRGDPRFQAMLRQMNFPP